MDELRGPNIQIVLHVKEGLGFGFLKSPFIVSGSLNGYLLETDPAVPCHGPLFDAELVWEAAKRRFRNLRVQNVPVKIEVFSLGTQGRKDKVGYLLLSLLGAQPCPSNKIIDVKHAWHRLLGVKSEGKCCHPQLLLSLSVEDRTSIHTPRNDLRMFHSNEAAYPAAYPTNPATARSLLGTVNDYLAASKKTAISPELQPKLLSDEGLIKIGAGNNLFILSFVIGTAENLQTLLPNSDASAKQTCLCYITYSVFTHDIMTDKVSVLREAGPVSAQFNQRSSLRVRSSLSSLSAYFAQCPLVVIRLCNADKDLGICSMDLRKLVPTDNLDEFVNKFCNEEGSLAIHERCFMLACEDRPRRDDGRRAYVDVEIGLKYVSDKKKTVRPVLSARSVTQLESQKVEIEQASVDYRSGSCTQLEAGVSAGYSQPAAVGERYRNAPLEPQLQNNEIAEMLRKMCETLALSQEGLRNCVKGKVDAEVQYEPLETSENKDHMDCKDEKIIEDEKGEKECYIESEIKKMESNKRGTNFNFNDKDLIRSTIPLVDREAIMKRFVDELEDWKERQQELYKIQLQRKEDYHLELLSREWEKRRSELEGRLSRGVAQCRALAGELAAAAGDFRLRGGANTARERQLIDAKKNLEEHYTAKYQELREASLKMEEEMRRREREGEGREGALRGELAALRGELAALRGELAALRNHIKNNEKEAESKYSGLTKDQTTSLIQELRQLEEKLDSAVQSKSFFKEQWGRAVRELHSARRAQRANALAALRGRRRELGLEPPEGGDHIASQDILKSKDDFYVDILVNTPGLESMPNISTSAASGLDGMEMYNDLMNTPKNPLNEKLNELIRRRDELVHRDDPDESVLKQLNHEIRSMLLNCGS